MFYRSCAAKREQDYHWEIASVDKSFFIYLHFKVVRSLLKNLHDKNLRTKSNKFTIYFLHRNHKQVKYSYLMVKVHTQETGAPWPGKEEIPAKPGGLGAVGHVPFFNMGI